MYFHILYTGCAKIKKIYSGAKRLIYIYIYTHVRLCVAFVMRMLYLVLDSSSDKQYVST